MTATAYHFHASRIQRSHGQSAVASAAYRHGEKYRDERTGELCDYSDRVDVLYTAIYAPKDAPEWVKASEQLWNHVEAFERKKNSQTAISIDGAIPKELGEQEREYLLKNFARKFYEQGLIVDAAIHAGGETENIHAHLMITTRKLDGEEFEKGKFRELNSKTALAAWRESWATENAKLLERMGFQLEADRWKHGHLTLPKQKALAIGRGDLEFAEACQQSIDEGKSRHHGRAAIELEKRGETSHRMESIRAERAETQEIQTLKQEIECDKVEAVATFQELRERRLDAPEIDMKAAAREVTAREPMRAQPEPVAEIMPTMPEVAASVERAADTVEHGVMKGAEIVTALGEGLANVVEGLFFGGDSRKAPGGAEYQQPTAAPSRQPEPAVPEWRRVRDALRTTSPEEAAQDPQARATLLSQLRQANAEITAEIRRNQEKGQQEKAVELELGYDDDELGRSRER